MNGPELCNTVKDIAKACLGLLTSEKQLNDDDKALAVGHLRRCQECKGEFTPEQRGRLVHDFVTNR